MVETRNFTQATGVNTGETASTLNGWNDAGKCKVKVEGEVNVVGSVSVEPGLVPLDVIVIV